MARPGTRPTTRPRRACGRASRPATLQWLGPSTRTGSISASQPRCSTVQAETSSPLDSESAGRGYVAPATVRDRPAPVDWERVNEILSSCIRILGSARRYVGAEHADARPRIPQVVRLYLDRVSEQLGVEKDELVEWAS